MSFFITDAMAQTAHTQAPANPMFGTILMIAGFILIFYFLIWRPQSRRAKQQRDLISSIKVGDEVMTSGGIVGKVTKLDDGFTVVEIAPGVEVTMQKASVSAVLPKGTLKS
jgi:preprotein translocase subunit YajC